MVTIVKGDLLDAKEKIIAHQVNCQKRMNSGVAKAIREKYPIVYEIYQETKPQLGYTDFINAIRNGDGHYIANMYAQDRYGYDGFKYTNYEAFYQCLTDIKKFAKEHSIIKSIAFPYRIGCDRGGANWKIIFTMIYEVFKDTDFNIEIISLGEIKE